MSDRVAKLLEKLYAATETPYNIKIVQEYLDTAEIEINMSGVAGSAGVASLPVGSLDEADIYAVILFLLQLVNTPADLTGALLIQPSLELLRDQAMAECAVSPADAQLITIISDAWFQALGNSEKNRVDVYMSNPNYEDCPLLTFHTVTSFECRKNGTYPLYAIFAYEFHKRLRFNEALPLELKHHLAYARSARFLFVYCSFKNRIFTVSDELPDELLKNFAGEYRDKEFEKLNRSRKKLRGAPRNRNIQDSAETHVQRVIDLWARRDKFKTFSVRRRTAKGDMEGPDESSPSDGNYTELPPAFEEEQMTMEPDSEGEEGACEDGGALLAGFYSGAGEKGKMVVDKDPEYHNRKWLDLIHLQNFHFYWDEKCLNLFHLAILYHSLDVLARNYHVDGSLIRAYFHFLMHTGMHAGRLLDLDCSLGDTVPDSTPELVNVNGVWYILNPRPVERKDDDRDEHCLPISKKTYIPIPQRLVEMLPGKLPEKYVFSYKNENKVKRISQDSVHYFLRYVNAAFQRYRLRITLARIRSSFQPLYCDRFGLDAVIACHVSGRDHHRLYGSQLHYTHVPHQKLAEQYLNAYDIVDTHIRKNLSECVERGLIFDSFEEVDSVKTVVPRVSGFAGYGSPYIPEESYLRKMIETLKDKIRTETDVLVRHNLYVIYCYLGTQFVTGLRPRKDPATGWIHVNSKTGTILINDKLSSKYREERILPLPGVLLRLLSNMRAGYDALQKNIRWHYVISWQEDRAGQTFYLIDSEGLFKSFTTKDMILWLDKIGIIYPFPPNMPRHYLRTYLYGAEISNELADIWMGHQHDGREAMNLTSSVIFSEAVNLCLPYIEKMFASLGFGDVPYEVAS